jgi:hypothetical protein
MVLLTVPFASWNWITSMPTVGSNRKLGLTNSATGFAAVAVVGVLLLVGAALMPEPLTGRPAWIDNSFDMADSYRFITPD